jgi:hypothetical protein
MIFYISQNGIMDDELTGWSCKEKTRKRDTTSISLLICARLICFYSNKVKMAWTSPTNLRTTATVLAEAMIVHAWPWVCQYQGFQGTLAIENEEMVFYITCAIYPQPQPLISTSPSSNIAWQNSIGLTARFVFRRGISIADVLFAGKTRTKQIT